MKLITKAADAGEGAIVLDANFAATPCVLGCHCSDAAIEAAREMNRQWEEGPWCSPCIDQDDKRVRAEARRVWGNEEVDVCEGHAGWLDFLVCEDVAKRRGEWLTTDIWLRGLRGLVLRDGNGRAIA